MEEEKGEWGFKALKKLTKLYMRKGEGKKVSEKFKQFMEYTKSAVTSNYSEKGINSILDSASLGKDNALTEELFQIAVNALHQQKNEVKNLFYLILQRVWFRTNLKLGKFLFDHGEFPKLARVRF